MKKNLVSIVDEYQNLDLIGNARSDSVIYDLPPRRTGKRGTPCSYKYFWQNRSPCLCDIPGKGFQKQASIFQHGFSGTAASILRLAGKIPAEPDGKQPYAVHPFDALRISMEH